jgi:hypothetical protein
MDDLNYEQIDHDSPEGETAHLFFQDIRGSVKDILEALHDSGAIPAGKYFRTTFGYSCGFKGHIAFVVEEEGDCGSSDEE